MQGGGGSWRDGWETHTITVYRRDEPVCAEPISNFHDLWLNVENEEEKAGSLINKTK